MKRLLLASTSTIYGGTYLSYLQEELTDFFAGIDEILFIPYARPSGITHDEYTAIAQQGFEKIQKRVVGLHTFADPEAALVQAKAIFTGGGNTFLLVTRLYELGLMPILREVVAGGTPYMGTSAGSNIAGQTMQTTNDMPIIYPPYLDPDPHSKHKGETRETRIKEFHKFNDIPVIGLREGSWLRITDDQIELKGNLTARVFLKDQPPYETTDLSPLYP